MEWNNSIVTFIEIRVVIKIENYWNISAGTSMYYYMVKFLMTTISCPN